MVDFLFLLNAHCVPKLKVIHTNDEIVIARELRPAGRGGRIVPVVDRVFAFDQLPAAKAYVEAGAQIGKVVVSLT